MGKKGPYRLYGIIGCPVKHSLSPYMHNAAFNNLKIKAAYLPFSVKRRSLKMAISSLRESGISGFNITIPFKSECMKYLDEIDSLAEMIGAVNTVVVKQSRFKGYNTDCAGFIRSLKEDLKFSPRGKDVYIAGSGGAARAVAFGLASEGAKRLFIYDILEPKVRLLARNIKRHFPNLQVTNTAKGDIARSIKSSSLFVNCTPLGMNKSDPLPVDIRLLHKGLKVYDIVYTPLETRLLKHARGQGIRTAGGLGMLLYQGAIAFEIWTQKKAPVALMRKELLRNLK